MATKRLHWLIVAALGCGALPACKAARPVPPHTVEEPRATPFPHSKHDSLECTDCHADVARSTKLGTAASPTPVKCAECHDARAADAAGQAIRALGPREQAVYQISFDHAAHLARIKERNACATCHEPDRLPEPGPARDWTPAMRACTVCHHHEKEVSQARCRPCHVSLRRYPLKPIEALSAFSHRGDFVRQHRDLAKSSAETCAQCHDQTYCAGCHANATVPLRPEIRFPEEIGANFIHRSDYVSRHVIEAARDPTSCRRCHGSFFCESCHQAQNVARESLSSNPRDPHPAGWTARDQHGRAARLDIISCAGCHDQGPASICVSCHRVGGIGGSPHPPGFTSRHDGSQIRTNAMCRTCHANG